MNHIEQFNSKLKSYQVGHNGIVYSRFELYLHTTYPNNIKTSKLRISFYATNRAKEQVVVNQIFFDTDNFFELENSIKELAIHKDFPSIDQIATQMICHCILMNYLDVAHVPSKLV